MAADVIASVRLQPARAVAFVVALLVVAGALWWLLRPPPVTPPEALLPVVTTGAASSRSNANAVTSMPPVASTVVVHVSGAVARPGVLHLPVGTRVVDAVDAAGGATPDADTDRVNLAALLADGVRVHVPRIGEVGGGVDGGAAPASADTPLDLNQATAKQLEDLPGIGPATAAAIIEHRERHGPFTSVDALGDVSGIGDAKLAQIRDLVRV